MGADFYGYLFYHVLFFPCKSFFRFNPADKGLDNPAPFLLYLPHREEGAYGL